MKVFVLEKKAAAILIKKELTISTAESCTGGLLAHRLTNIPKSSKFFLGGFVAYNLKTKAKLLKIDRKLLYKYGTISARCAIEMAKKTKTIIGSDIAISITGLAGPGSIEGKLPGKVYIAINFKGDIDVKEHNFKGSRGEIKYKATTHALKLLLSKICKP